MNTSEFTEIIFPERGKVTVETAGLDRAIGPGEIAGGTLHTLISPGTEMNLLNGSCHDEGLVWGRFPVRPGYAAVFQIEAVGDSVAVVFEIGQVINCSGKHASWQKASAKEALLLPDGLDPRRALLGRMLNVTWPPLSIGWSSINCHSRGLPRSARTPRRSRHTLCFNRQKEDSPSYSTGEIPEHSDDWTVSEEKRAAMHSFQSGVV